MRKILFGILMMLCSSSVFAQLDTPIKVKKSEIKWSGSQLFSFNKHYGTVNFKEGRMQFDRDKLKSGSLVIDMTTLANVDGGYNEGLVGHLKDPDFFDVEKYPTATLKITKVTYDNVMNTSLEVEADLTIKGITKPITFTAQTNSSNGTITFTSKLIIDRSRWEIKYGSRSFFKDLGNNTISDAIAFEVIIIVESC